MLERDCGEVLIQVTFEFSRVVRCPKMIDGECRVAIRANCGKLGAMKGANKPPVVLKYTHKLKACMILHWAFPEIVGGFVKEERRAGIAIQIGVESPRKIEAGAHPGRSWLPVARIADTGHT